MAQTEARSGGSVFHVCLERVSRLEGWLHEAQRSLVATDGAAADSTTMQDSVERQLLTCQEMFLEIEQKFSSMSTVAQTADRQNELGEALPLGSTPEGAELLASKLELLKSNLVLFQQLLLDRQGETHGQPPPSPPPHSALRRRSSVQEILSSPRNKLPRQSSLQQQKELEQDLCEQRGLTLSISRQGSRATLSLETEEAPCLPPTESDVETDSTHTKKWSHLHRRLLCLEEGWLLPPRQVTDSSIVRSDGTAGCVIILKDLQSHISRLTELRHTATENQTSPDESSLQSLDEGLFDVLSGASLCLSAINNMLHTATDGDTQTRLLQIQSLSSELCTLGSELSCDWSNPGCVPGSKLSCDWSNPGCVPGGKQCVEDVCRMVPVVQAALSSKEKQLRNTQEETASQQMRLNELHAAFTSNLTTVQQITNEFTEASGLNKLQAVSQVEDSLAQQVKQVNSLLAQHNLPASLFHQATQLQGELDSTVSRVQSHREELKASEELQRLYERLVHSLGELVTLGPERTIHKPDTKDLECTMKHLNTKDLECTTQKPHTEFHDRAKLQEQHDSDKRFFRFLGDHGRTLQYLTHRVPDSALLRWEGEVTALQTEVERLQQQGLEKGVRVEHILQMWSQWEEESAWSESLLTQIETSIPKMQQGGDCDKLTVYQDLCSVFEGNKIRFGRMLEAGFRLQGAGCRGLSTNQLAARWKTLNKKVEEKYTDIDKTRKLRNRFSRDCASLCEWMAAARDQIDRLSQLSVPGEEEMEAQQRREHYRQFVALTKELEAKRGLKVAVVGSGTQLTQLKEPTGGSGVDNLDINPEDSEISDLDSDLSPVHSQLRQTENDWSILQADVPVLQQALHKRWMQTLSQQGALEELQAWVKGAVSGLEEHRSTTNQTSSTNNDLSQLLKYCKESQLELSAHQATLDYVNRPVQTCSTDDGHRGRCTHNRFAEEQGDLNYQWLSLTETLNTQTRALEGDLRLRAQRESKLLQANSWISQQNVWLESVQSPSNHTELQRSIDTCKVLEESIQQKFSSLQDFRDKLDEGENISAGFISQTDTAIQACQALTQRTQSVSQQLIQGQCLWVCVQNGLDELVLKTVRTRQTLEYHCSPQLCLQAHRETHGQLQILHEETESTSSEWNRLSETFSRLRDTISPEAAGFITEQLERERERWAVVSCALDHQLHSSQDLLCAWDRYALRASSFSDRLDTLQTDTQTLQTDTQTPQTDTQRLQTDTQTALSGAERNTVEQVAGNIIHVQSLQERTDILQSDLEEVLEASKDLIGHMEPSAACLVQSESRMLSRGVQRLSHSLTEKLAQLQEELERLQEFENNLESLERNLELWQQRVETAAQISDQSGLLQSSGRSADLDVLNEQSRGFTLCDAVTRRLQRLNLRWAQTQARTDEACSVLQMEALSRQSFQQQCESWMSFLQNMEDSLTEDVAGSYSGLRQQLCTHKRFQAEMSIGHQILHSVLTEALHLLHKGEVDDRSDFILKLSQLREHWQGAVQRAEQRRSLVEGLVKHWHVYRRSLNKLQRFLSDTQTLIHPAGPARSSLKQLRRTLQQLQHTELLFQRYQSSFFNTLEVGRQLFAMGDQDTQNQLQSDLGTLQEDWDNLHSQLGRRMELTDAIVKNWETCESRLADSLLELKDVKTRLNQSRPDSDDDLQSDEKFNKETEALLSDWAERLTQLSSMKTDLSQYLMSEDVLLLQEQVEHLHCQWDDLCLKMSLRKQEIADRLSAWMIFNQKNKELCDWLTQMEHRVEHTSDLNIEEMVEKLKKDCMEEINLFSENKTHLKQLGEQLISASNKTKETEANDKLQDINDRWQHLFDHIETRVGKLKETLVTVQQLDQNMSTLRTWLSHMEAELSKPVVYSVCHSHEIHSKLAEQQDLQRDIEQHTDSVASVLTLCDVLLHDVDACGSDSENDSIQQTTRSLDRRWRNICAMSMERRMRIEETWRLWCKFLEDFSRFEDWLKTAELTAASPESANVLYTSAKEELKKFEAFQRQVHERLTQLELVNKQYRRLSRENRTDAASKLKVMVCEGNQRWDALQRRVAAILRRLKHFTSQREEFEGTREAILVWLTEMDLQLTNVEHFSESDVTDKMRQLNGFQQEITLNTNKIDSLIVFGENLIQKSFPLDAVLIEDELQELHSYCQEVFGRVARFHHRLTHRRPILEEERDHSDLEDSPDVTNNSTSWIETDGSELTASSANESSVSAGGQVMCQLLANESSVSGVCHLLAPPLERSGRETPVSVDSIPLEWDHTVDVGGSSSHEEDEDASFFSVKSVTDPPSWHQPDSPERHRVPTHTSTPYRQQGYARLMSECSGSINSVKRVKLMLNDEEELEGPGPGMTTADKQTSTGVIERWELLSAQHTDRQADLDQWQKLNSDLCDVTSWLGRVLPELDRLQRIAPSTSVRDIEVNIRKLKEMQKTFNSYKSLMISVNLASRHFLVGDSAELRELDESLLATNQSWAEACGALQSWERRLHGALMQCQEFHETLHSLLLWLSQAENKLSLVNLSDASTPRPVLLQHRDTLTALQIELCGRQRKVSSLQEISTHLLLEAEEADSLEAKEKVHVICNKLRLLLRQTAADLHTLRNTLETCPTSSEMDSIGLGTLSSPSLMHKEETVALGATAGKPATRRDDRRDAPPGRPLFYRVLRAAFPLHLLFLVLLVLTCLVPLSEEDYSCTLTNNFARSFYPMLRYTNGPPPT